jgi:hypothetical protein
MNHALTLRYPAPLRIGPLLMLCIAFLLASAVCITPTLAPTLAHTAGVGSHSEVCKCAHCSGGLTCCCRLAGKCLIP